MKVTVDQDKCVASGQCVMAAVEVFDQRDEDGIVVLLDPTPPTGSAEDVRHAASVGVRRDTGETCQVVR